MSAGSESISQFDWANFGIQIGIGAAPFVPKLYQFAARRFFGESVQEILNEINGVLSNTRELLTANQSNIAPNRYAEFQKMYTGFYTDLTFESHPSSSNPQESASQLKPLDRAKNLREQVGWFHTNVLSESRKQKQLLAFNDMTPSELESQRSIASYGVSTRTVNASTSRLSPERRSQTSSSLAPQINAALENSPSQMTIGPVTAHVTYVPVLPNSADKPRLSEGPAASDDQQVYRRGVTFTSEQGTLYLTGPNLYSLKESETRVSKEKLDQLAEHGRAYLSWAQQLIANELSIGSSGGDITQNAGESSVQSS